MQMAHGFSKGVIGRDMYSDNTLRHMSKSDLIELLKIAQNNYEAVLESYGNVVAYSEKLLKCGANAVQETTDSEIIEVLKKTLTDLTKAIAKIDEYSQYERARTAGEFAGRLKQNYSKALFYISDYETLVQRIDDITSQMTGGKT